MRILSCADSGLLVEMEDLDEVLALHTALKQQPPPGVLDLVPAAKTLLVRLDPRVADPQQVRRSIRRTSPVHAETTDEETVTVPVVYDGADLVTVAELTGLSEREVITAHTDSSWQVAFGGFAPGFGYLTGGDDRLEVPRRTESRTSVPAGSVGLAGRFSGIYPSASPGGWQLIGRTDLEIWRIDRDPPALLRPGVRVRFEEVR